MAGKDLHSNVKELMGLNAQTISSDTTTNGNIIDTAGYESVVLVFFSGTVTDGTYTPLVQEGAASDLSDAAAVADADLLPDGTGQEATAIFEAADDNAVEKLGYRGSKRYIRPNFVSASTSTGATSMGCIAILGHPTHMPVA